jgi:hypothetical protein
MFCDIRKVLLYACKHDYDWIKDISMYHIEYHIIDLFYVALQYNKLNLGKWLYAIEPNIDLNLYPDLFVKVKHKDVSTYEWLLYIRGKTLNRDEVALAFNNASDYNNVELCKWLYDYNIDYRSTIIHIMHEGIDDDGDESDNENENFTVSWTDKNLSTFKFLHEIEPDYILLDQDIIQTVCEFNSPLTLKWLFKIYDENNIILDTNILYDALICAINYICTDMALDIWKRIGNTIVDINHTAIGNRNINHTTIFITACKNSQLELIKLMYANGYINESVFYKFNDNIYMYKLDICKWIITIVPTFFDKHISSNVCLGIIRRNDIELWQWIKSKAQHKEIHDYLYLLLYTCEYGTVEMFKFLYGYRSGNLIKWLQSGLNKACKMFNIKMYRELVNMGIIMTDEDWNELSINACITNDLKLLKEIGDHISFSHLKDKLFSIKGVGGRLDTPSNSLFCKICKNGYIDIVKYLYENMIIDNKFCMASFLCACSDGDLPLCKLLYSKYRGESILYYACQNATNDNHLIVLQWLYTLENMSSYTFLYDINYDDFDEYNFVKPDYIMIEWIYSNYSGPDNLQKLFDYACICGYTQLCKIIYMENKINIRNHNDWIFKFCCKQKYVPLCYWLVSLNPDVYQVILHNNTINYKINIVLTKSVIINDADLCSVCNDESEIITVCNHTFCKDCLQLWTNSNSFCPMCRQEIEYSDCSTIKID